MVEKRRGRATASQRAFSAIAERFKVSPDAVWRHGREHLSPELKAALALKLIRREGDTRAVLLEEGAGAVEALRAGWASLRSAIEQTVRFCLEHKDALERSR